MCLVQIVTDLPQSVCIEVRRSLEAFNNVTFLHLRCVFGRLYPFGSHALGCRRFSKNRKVSVFAQRVEARSVPRLHDEIRETPLQVSFADDNQNWTKDI